MKLNLKVLFDNPNPDRMDRGWGVSFLLNDTILFDTTESMEKLQQGLDFFNVDLRKIIDVVISHDHWDHTGGLLDFIAAHPAPSRLNVYLLPSFSPELKEQVMMTGVSLHLNNATTSIQDGFFLTGEIDATYKGVQKNEQGLVAEGKTGFALVTGCAHPGIARMLKVAMETIGNKLTPSLVAGGFHLMDKDENEIERVFNELREMGAEKLGPCHCSGITAKNICKRMFPDFFVDIRKNGEYSFDL
ncbi:MAG: MBL fold metallo-hydrolase [Holophagae bacterium]|nr:MBL fold metallo-hydrolase [Holophagae bacterium]